MLNLRVETVNYIEEFIEGIARKKERLKQGLEHHLIGGDPEEGIAAAMKEYEEEERKFVSYITDFLMTMSASRIPRKLVMETIDYYQQTNQHGKRMLQIWDAFVDEQTD